MMRSTVYPFPNSSKDTMSPRDWRPMERWRGDRTGSAKIQGPQNQSCIDHKPFTHPRSFNSYSEFSPEKMGDCSRRRSGFLLGCQVTFQVRFAVKLWGGCICFSKWVFCSNMLFFDVLGSKRWVTEAGGHHAQCRVALWAWFQRAGDAACWWDRLRFPGRTVPSL